MNLLIYYNVNQKNFYVVYTNYIGINRRVGDTNGFGHVLVQILSLYNQRPINLNSLNDMRRYYHKESIKSRLAKRIIRWLNKYRE